MMGWLVMFSKQVLQYSCRCKKVFRCAFQMWGSIKISRTHNHTTCGTHPSLNQGSQPRSVHPQGLCFCSLTIFTLTRWVQDGVYLGGFSWTLYAILLHHRTQTQYSVCFETVVTIISYLWKTLFLWLKCKPHEIRSYASTCLHLILSLDQSKCSINLFWIN